MTTIAYRDGYMSADSSCTTDDDSLQFQCTKIFRKGNALIGLSGEDGPGMIFLEWYGTKLNKRPQPYSSKEAFEALVATPEGVFRFDRFFTRERVIEPYHAIGSGAACAFVAMDMGATAEEAVRAACRRNPFSRPPIVTEKL